MNPQVHAMLLCDDVREEVGGKNTFVGAYGDQIEVNTRPAVLVTKLVTITSVPPEGLDLEIEVTFNRTNIHKASIPPGFTAFNGTLPLTIFMTEEKPLTVKLREAGGEWSLPWIWDIRFSDQAVDLPEEQAKAIRDRVVAMPPDTVKTMERQD